jgi:hypothetical protein
MPFNGSGTFVRLYNWVNDAANGIKISATRMDAETDGIAAGLSNCITRDGQGVPTANIGWGGYNLTGVATLGVTTAISGNFNFTGSPTYQGDGIVTVTGAQTLTNKTLTSPSISNPVITGVLTIPGGGTITDGSGVTKFTAAASTFGLGAGGLGASYFQGDGSQFYPTTDNSLNLGTSSFRWAVVYAGTGTINTSDETQKTFRAGGATAGEIAWATAIRADFRCYQLNDAIAEKGDAARLHFGVGAKSVYAKGIAAGIADSFRYAFLCRDRAYRNEPVPADFEVIEGVELIVEDAIDWNPVPQFEADGTTPKYNWGIRYDELQAFLAYCGV